VSELVKECPLCVLSSHRDSNIPTKMKYTQTSPIYMKESGVAGDERNHIMQGIFNMDDLTLLFRRPRERESVGDSIDF